VTPETGLGVEVIEREQLPSVVRDYVDRVEDVGERGLQPSGRPARGHRDIAVEQVAAGGHRLEVIVDEFERQALVGDDPIEVVHQIGLGHRRQLAEAVVIESGNVDAGQPLAVPRRAVDGLADEVSQPLCAMECEAIRRPIEPLDESPRSAERAKCSAASARCPAVHRPKAALAASG
jgi:hypothetical protein